MDSAPRIGETLAPWERVLLALFALGLGVFMLWGTFAWMFLSGLALGRACGGSLTAGAGVGTVLGVVVGLMWTLVLSLLVTAARGRGLRGRIWLVGPALCLALVAIAVIDEARTPLPSPLRAPPTATPTNERGASPQRDGPRPPPAPAGSARSALRPPGP